MVILLPAFIATTSASAIVSKSGGLSASHLLTASSCSIDPQMFYRRSERFAYVPSVNAEFTDTPKPLPTFPPTASSGTYTNAPLVFFPVLIVGKLASPS